VAGDDDLFSPERIGERVALIRDIADDALKSGLLPADKIVLRGIRIPLLVSGYFLLNAAYKKWRIKEGHYTEPPKIAALTCLSIMTFVPFRPLDPDNVTTITEARCNEIFALECASVLVGVPIQAGRENTYRRVLDILAECRSETLEAYRVDQNMQVARPLPDYDLAILPADHFKINSMITILECLSGKANGS